MISNDQYFSVVIPYFLQQNFLKRLVDSIHKYADMPFEIIVHDDHSEDLSSLYVKDDVSTIILNFGLNLGLAAAANRAVQLASSKYVLFINQDCEFIAPCLRDYANVLDKPYVGIVSPYGDGYPMKTKEWIVANGTKFSIFHGIAAGCTFAFRKDVWEHIGGFEDIISGCSDTPFIYKIWREGYFRAVVLGEKRIRNVDLEDHQQKHSTIGRTGTDCCYPKVFPHSMEDLRRHSKQREAVCQRYQDMNRHEPAGISNIDYWDQYSKSIVQEDGVISDFNWENANKHGQIKWREQIEREDIQVA